MYAIADKYKDDNHCYELMSKIYREIKGKDISLDDIRYLNDDDNHIQRCMDIIDNLETHIFMGLSDSSGNDRLMDHYFVLYKEDGNVYRIEAYVDTYKTRIVEWNSYKEDIYSLLTCMDRVGLWNSIFDSNEQYTTEFEIDVVIFT